MTTMHRNGTRTLSDDPDEPQGFSPNADAPLADLMRSRTLNEYVAQGYLLGPGRLVRKLVAGGVPLPSLIL